MTNNNSAYLIRIITKMTDDEGRGRRGRKGGGGRGIGREQEEQQQLRRLHDT